MLNCTRGDRLLQLSFLYEIDILKHSSGGANNTCEVLMRMLESLGAADKLPKDPKNRV
eukprot:SAG11_NODE_33905_length_274_cov_8.674286_1_plen_57_part_01